MLPSEGFTRLALSAVSLTHGKPVGEEVMPVLGAAYQALRLGEGPAPSCLSDETPGFVYTTLGLGGTVGGLSPPPILP